MVSKQASGCKTPIGGEYANFGSFWINLPLGAISFTAVLFTLKDTQNEFQRMTFKKRLAEIDILGAILLIGGIASLLLALQRGGITYKWSDPRVWPLMAAFGASMPIFCVVQWKRGERATIPPRLLLRQRTILASSFFTCFLAMASFMLVKLNTFVSSKLIMFAQSRLLPTFLLPSR